MCVCVRARAVWPLNEVCVGLTSLNSSLLFSSDSSSPNHQADPGSHGNAEVSLQSTNLVGTGAKVKE